MICICTRSLRGTELKKNDLGLVKCLQIPFHVDKCIWSMAAVFGHGREVNECANTLPSTVEIVILRTVRISQCGRQSSPNTGAEVAHFLPRLLSNFTIRLFWYAESGIVQKIFPGIVDCLLPVIVFQQPLHPFHPMFE